MRLFSAFLAAALPFAAQVKLPPAAEIKIDFEKHVQPLLAEKCFTCHGNEVQQSGLRLDRRQNALRGGDYGPVIVPGNSAQSKLIRRVVSGDGGMRMPPTGPLTNEEIGILRAWIDQGAEYYTEVKEEAPPPPVDPKVERLIAAARSGDARRLGGLLHEDPGLIQSADRARSTLLHHAAGFGSLEQVKLLLDRGASVNAKNSRQSTPLHWAIHDEAKVRLLLGRGAGVNTQQAEGRTPLYLAASLGNGDATVRLLLEKGADPNLASAPGITPLMIAALRGSVETVRLLLGGGAKVNAASGAGLTALMAAASSGNPRAVEVLLKKGADANALSKRNETALANAATSGVEESVKLLLAAGAKVNVRDDRGYSPLMYAAGSDTMPAGVVKMLLAKGADASYTGDDETAMSLASKRGHTDVARLLGGKADNSRADRVVEREPYAVSESVRTALALLEKQSHNFIRIGGCNSCHSQDLPSAAVGLARDRGLPAPASIPQLPPNMVIVTTERAMDFGVIAVVSVGWELFDLGMNHAPKDAYTDAIVRYIKAMQTPEGNWHATESRRPPMAAGEFQTAALSVYSMVHYGPDAEAESTRLSVARAARWLENARSTTTQDRAYHLLGLVWAGGSEDAIKRVAKELAAMQRSDGGWSQLPAMDSDAYATGQALYALASARLNRPADPVYQKGTRYLLRTQAPDGSWHVKSRSIWFQPYFESGFPYAQDQWISAAGTAWASMALSMSVEPAKEPPAVSAKATQ